MYSLCEFFSSDHDTYQNFHQMYLIPKLYYLTGGLWTEKLAHYIAGKELRNYSLKPLLHIHVC